MSFLEVIAALCVSTPLLFFAGLCSFIGGVSSPRPGVLHKKDTKPDLRCITTQQKAYPFNERVVGEIARRERAYRRRVERLGAGWRRGRRIRESRRRLSFRQS